jgi:hypothetical protein
MLEHRQPRSPVAEADFVALTARMLEEAEGLSIHAHRPPFDPMELPGKPRQDDRIVRRTLACTLHGRSPAQAAYPQESLAACAQPRELSTARGRGGSKSPTPRGGLFCATARTIRPIRASGPREIGAGPHGRFIFAHVS